MCSIYHLDITAEELREVFATLRNIDFKSSDLQASYLIKPTHAVTVIRQAEDGTCSTGRVQWGLIPQWAKDRKGALINARSETIASKPSFRTAFKSRRCIIPASGFYENESTSSKTFQRYHIYRRDGALLPFAGIWDTWLNEDEPLETCSIVTTEANSFMRQIHDRIPVILPSEAFAEWLNPTTDTTSLQQWFRACPDEWLTRDPVANTQEDSPKCIRPVKPQRGLFD